MPRREFYAKTALVCLGLASCYSPNNPISGSHGSTDETEGSGETGDVSTQGPTSATTEGTHSSSTADDSSSEGPSGTGAPEPFCGDGRINGDEVCDDGVNDGSYGGCFPNCGGLAPHCGDADVQGEEACDDGNDVEADGCNSTCVVSGSVVWTRTFGTDYASGVAIDELDGVAVVTGTATMLYFATDGVPGSTHDFELPGATSTYANGANYHETVGWAFVGYANTPSEARSAWWQIRSPGSDLSVVVHGGTYDNPDNTDDRGEAIAFDAVGNYFVCGRSDIGAPSDTFLRKYSPNGDLLWAQIHDGGGNDVASAVAVDPDGSAVVGGGTSDPESGFDAWLRKYDPEGAVLWTRTSTSPGADEDFISGVAIGSDGEIAVAGQESDDIWVRLYNSQGAAQWTDIYDGPAEGTSDSTCGVCFFSDTAGSVAIDSTGAVVVVGHQMVASLEAETWIRKYSADGEVLWTEAIAPDVASSYQHAYSVAIDSTDHVVVVGNWEDQGWAQKRAP